MRPTAVRIGLTDSTIRPRMDRLPNEHAETLDLHFDALSARPRRDERLFLAASARWEDCRQAFIELMADAPKDHWDAWWAERAPGTAVSRWTRATQLFRAHFDAAAQVTFAQGLLDVEQLKTLQASVDPAQNPGDPAAVTTERLGGPPVLHEGGWTAALVITAASGPVLYLPARQPAFLPFKQRSALEDHLSREQLSILADSPQHDPLLAALSRWREHYVEVQHSAFTLLPRHLSSTRSRKRKKSLRCSAR